MKKLLTLMLMFGFVFSIAACSTEEEAEVVEETTEEVVEEEVVEEEEGFKIAMITDAGEIDDESFNQGTWEGIVAFAEENDITHKYYKPLEVSDNAYLDAIALAVEGGAEIIVAPGFLFSVAIFEAQDLYPDVKFIIMDAEPHSADWSEFRTEANVLNILFNEHESGFLAGYAAVRDGYTSLGFVGGMAVPAVVKFGIGYVAGAYLAADELGVELDLGDNTYHYMGNFAPSDEAKNLAASWYVNGTEVIFAAAGGAGLSVFAAADEAGANSIGVDVDQSYLSPSVITSAKKELAVAVGQGLQDWLDGTWEGGRTVAKGAENGGVGLPMDTSLFTTFTEADYEEVFAKVVSGEIDVPIDTDELAAFLADLGVEGPSADKINNVQ